MQIRLCGIPETLWLEKAEKGYPDLPPPPRQNSKTSIGSQLMAKIEQRGGIHAAMESGPERLVLAHSGVKFGHPDFVVSVAHALALAGTLDGRSDQAFRIEGFVAGNPPHDQVPEYLRNAGVYSILHQADAIQLGRWIQERINTRYEEEVADMHGPDAVSDYVAAATSLATIFESTQLHDCDLCCYNSYEER